MNAVMLIVGLVVGTIIGSLYWRRRWLELAERAASYQEAADAAIELLAARAGVQLPEDWR